ncbi:MAG: tyrosine-type recombinase/integrase [Anaerolineae bacterium]|nr:tyrosine-type recombinase/integrase [Thermoflexales bacterium]MDW8407154.1 tyrosine-type recombinase/integrase [Anaerolineae bacterium]
MSDVNTEPFRQAIPRFLSELSGFSPRTLDTYRYALTAFIDANIPIDENLLQAFDEYLSKRKYYRGNAKRPYSRATRSLYLAALRRFLEWLDAHDQLPAWTRAKAEARLKAARSRQPRSGVRHRIPDDRLHEMITFYDDLPDPVGRDAHRRRLELYRNRALLHCLWDSAARVSELLQLTRAQVADGQVDRVVILGKGQKERYIFFTRESQAAIRAYCRLRDDSYPGLFVSHRRDKGARLSRISAWNIVKRAARGSGLAGMVSPHMIRHARAIQLVNEGMPMESVQLVLGHESIATTQAYYAKLKPDIVKSQLDEYGLSPRQLRRKPAQN